MSGVKCESCGATFDVREDGNKCPYCGTRCTMPKSMQEDDEGKTTIINNYYTNSPGVVEVAPPPTSVAPSQMSQADINLYYAPRPKIRIFWVLLGLCFYVWPGIIYIVVQAARQKKWDQLHGI